MLQRRVSWQPFDVEPPHSFLLQSPNGQPMDVKSIEHDDQHSADASVQLTNKVDDVAGSKSVVVELPANAGPFLDSRPIVRSPPRDRRCEARRNDFCCVNPKGVQQSPDVLLVVRQVKFAVNDFLHALAGPTIGREAHLERRGPHDFSQSVFLTRRQFQRTSVVRPGRQGGRPAMFPRPLPTLETRHVGSESRAISVRLFPSARRSTARRRRNFCCAAMPVGLVLVSTPC